MLKKTFLILSFIFVFFSQPIISYSVTTAQPTSQTDEQVDPWEQFWNSIVSWFEGLFGTTSYITKDVEPSTRNDNKLNTDYTSKQKDITTRGQTSENRKFQLGVYLNDIIHGRNGYKNEPTSSDRSSCPSLKPSDVVYYFYKNKEKVLYDPNDYLTPIDYDDNLMKKFEINLVPDKTCYINYYNNLEIVPHGEFQGKEDGATSTSVQLNQTTRLSISSTDQGEDTSKTNYNPSDARSITKDTWKQEGNMLLGKIPADSNFECGSSKEETRENLRDIFGEWLTPLDPTKDQNNDSELSERTDTSGNNASNCTKSGHGQGMSQYGALGMALSDYSYQDILSSYYGDSSLGITLTTINTSRSNIVVALVNEDGNASCVELATKYSSRFKYTKNNFVTNSGNKVDTFTLNIEDYLKGLGEMPLYWEVEAHKAQSVAARTYALNRTGNLSRPIRNTSSDQVFRCKKLLLGVETPNNQTQAVDETIGEVLHKNGKVFSTSYSSCHGQASLSPPYFDGTEFERLAKAPIKSRNGICTTSSLTTSVSGSDSSSTSGLFIFNGAKHQSRIAERYDIGTIDGGKFLKTYSGTCRLDFRIFPALDQLMAGAQSNGIKIKLLSCYRSIAEQQPLWEETLAKYNGDEKIAAKWTAKPGTSAHHTGRAIDFGDPTKSKEGSKLYSWLLKNGARFGFYNYQPEPWHWEYNP